ncbi:ClpP/crotonase-like domain-containing protein [Lipomyces tetrasporus]|uniref:ClpP/crotonase-like domain-containing protein n=1 Tax=Lipomyces tetrasporus TaxID=54092 RepID=A0AAD7VT89_9ASCO|nr:ClpP/crotonase-like domain-containing protein [Lipomyces tetrasporus]KAJ8101842.1 ClpP/crotonase-like domain-containing protein [Lipomyces tetrasporus]
MGSINYSGFSLFNIQFPTKLVAHVEINRLQKLNAFNRDTWTQLRDIFNLISIDPNVRVVILSGAGERAFTSGLEISPQLMALLNGGDYEEERARFITRRAIRDFQDSISAIENCSKPVIGLVHGIAFGLAIDILSATDIRMCTSDVQFSVKEVDIGLAADIGTLQRLPKVVKSLSWCKDVVYTARVFGAQEALVHGFVSKVAENKQKGFEDALELANVIAAKSPIAVQGSKHLINYSKDRTVQEGLEYTATWNAFAIGRDMKDAIAAALSKAKPRYGKL